MVADKQAPQSDVLDLIEDLQRRLEQVERQIGQVEVEFASDETVHCEVDSDDTVSDLATPAIRSTITNAALESNGVVILIVDAAGRVLHVDGAAEELTGYSADEVVGQSLWDTVVSAEDAVQVHLTYAELHAGQRRNRHETTFVSPDGRRTQIAWCNSAIPDANDAVKFITSSGVAVAEPSALAPSRPAENERYRHLIEFSPDVIWEYEFVGLQEVAARLREGATTLQRVCDPQQPEFELRAVFVSSAVQQLLGFTPEEMRSLSLQRHFTTECLEHCYEILAGHLEQELTGLPTDPVVIEMQAYHKSGEVVQTRARIQFTRDENGFPMGLAGVSADITRERQAERALQESLEQFRVLVESTPTAILVHTRGRLVYANPEAARLFRVDSPQQLVGRAVLDMVHPDSLDRVKQRMCDVLDKHLVAPIQQVTLIRADGSEFVAEAVGVPITHDGEPSVQVVLADVSERQRIQQQERGREEIRRRFEKLSPRESEVLQCVVAGKPNKAIAAQLGISIKTVEHHRSNVMKKTRSKSIADLVRITLLSGWSADPGRP